MTETDWFVMSGEVRAALADGRPVVALESSIVAQGFPPPANLEVAAAMEQAVRAAGGTPAMVALLDGAVRIGLDEAARARLVAGEAVKCSARDLGPVLARGAVGATTVAATARLAAMAGIAVFATGGIGGVHPAGGDPGARDLDVSADLMELARQPVAVVASGAKSILDLAATYALLDALAVPVIGVRTDEFPAFHTAASGIRLKHRIDDPEALARAVRLHWRFPGAGAVLVCNPPPAAVALDSGELAALVDTALARARQAGIAGDAVTPYVLAALNELSGGRTLAANHALAVDNARLGAELAAALAA